MHLILTYDKASTTTTTINVRIGDIFKREDPALLPLVKKLGGLTFLMSSCIHKTWAAIISRKLGGINLTDIESITILDMDHNTDRIAVGVQWETARRSEADVAIQTVVILGFSL